MQAPDAWNLPGRTWRKFVRSDDQQLKTKLKSRFPVKSFPIVYFNTVANLDLLDHFIDSNRKIICHVHELSHVVSAIGRKKQLHASVPHVDSFIAPSQAVVDYLHNEVGVPLSKLTLVHEFPAYDFSHNGDSASFRSKARTGLRLTDSDFVVGMCGNLEWRKGIDLFIQMAVKLKDALPDGKLRCIWIGGDSERDDIRHDISKAGVADVVTLLPTCQKPQEMLPAFDVFALTSREDPYPLVMLEAASASLPIVCFDKSGGPPEFVTAGGCGFIAPYLNVDAFADHCLSLANDKNMRQTLGDRAREHARKHLIDVQAPKLLSVIEKYL